MHRMFAAGLLIACSLASQGSSHALEAKDVKRATDRAGNWLVEQYDRETKVFGKQKDVTTVAMVISALCQSPRDYKETNGPFISEPVKYLLSKIKEDGSLEGVKENTDEALIWMVDALTATQNDKYKELIAKFGARLNLQPLANPQGQPKPSATKVKPPVWTRLAEITSLPLDIQSLQEILHTARHYSAQKKKEIELEGKNVKWAEVLASTMLKLQQTNGAFDEDVRINALGLSILTVCYTSMK